MKKIISALALFGFMLSMAGNSQAASTSASAPVSATVVASFSLGMVIKEETGQNPITLGPALTEMNHGTLTNVDASGNPTTNALRGKAFHLFPEIRYNGGARFTLMAKMDVLKAADGTALPRSVGEFAVVKTQGGAMKGTFASTAGRDAVSTANRLLYTSNAAGQGEDDAHSIEIVYGYSGGNANGSAPFTGWQPTPPDQKANV